jgi:hypothetical protein
LLKRVFDIDIEQCPQCGGTLTILAAIEDPSVIAKILTHRLAGPGTAPVARAAMRSTSNAFYEGPVVKPRRQLIFCGCFAVPRRSPPELFTLCPRTQTFSQS